MRTNALRMLMLGRVDLVLQPILLNAMAVGGPKEQRLEMELPVEAMARLVGGGQGIRLRCLAGRLRVEQGRHGDAVVLDSGQAHVFESAPELILKSLPGAGGGEPGEYGLRKPIGAARAAVEWSFRGATPAAAAVHVSDGQRLRIGFDRAERDGRDGWERVAYGVLGLCGFSAVLTWLKALAVFRPPF